MKISMFQCKRRLAIVWFVGAGILFLLLFALTMADVYRDRTREVWEWFLPSVAPTIALMVGVSGFDATSRTDDRAANRFFFRLTMTLSVVYLLVIATSLVTSRLAPLAEGQTEIDRLQRSNLAIGPLQGVVAAAIGGFFVRDSKKANEES